MKEFSRADKLKAHIITHSGIKPYKCRECGRAFGRKPHLREHERGHKADYRFKCDICHKGFNRPKLYHGHRCQPNKTGTNSLFRPKHKRKVGRPRKHPLVEKTEMVSVSQVKKDNHMNYMASHADSIEIAPIESVKDAETSSTDDKSSLKGIKKQPDFCVKVSTPSTRTRFVTVQISNTPAPTDGQGNQMVQQSHQILSPQGTSVPITIIEGNMCLPMQGMEQGAGDNITMQMITPTGCNNLATMNGVVSELVPVAVMQDTGTDSSMITTQVVNVSAAGDQSYLTCGATLDDYTQVHGDPGLQVVDNFLKAEIVNSDA